MSGDKIMTSAKSDQKTNTKWIIRDQNTNEKFDLSEGKHTKYQNIEISKYRNTRTTRKI